MSNWCYLLSRSALRLRCHNIRPPVKFSPDRQSIYSAVNKNYGREIFTTAFKRNSEIQKSPYATRNNLRIDQDNVVSSPFPDVNIPREFLHEYIWKNLERWPSKTAVVCSTTGKSYTYSELRTLSGKFAASLRKCKFYPNSTIAVVLPNVVEYAIIVLGASEAGISITMMNPISTAKEISRQLQASEAFGVITSSEQYPVVKASLAGCSNIKLPAIIVDEPNHPLPEGCIRFSELISDSVEVFSESAIPGKTNEDVLFLPYSSGTTGLPKGVEISHRNVTVNCEQLQVEGVYPAHETTETHQEVVPLILPAFHIYGLVVVILNYLSVGAKIVFVRKFSPENFLNSLKDFKSTILYAAPPMILFLGSSELVTDNHLKTLKFIMSGAAPIGAESVQKVLRKAKRDIPISQGYGLTEASPVVTSTDNGIDNLDAVGYLIPNTSLRIVNLEESRAGQNMGVNETGELYVKGPQVMKGYYKNPEATANTLDGEWLKTGDIACFDETGRVMIKDRIKELIKVKGFQVAPAELEELLRTNDEILDAAVVGEPHPKYGEMPKAFVVCKPGVKSDGDKIKKFIAERVPSYKQLGSVKFIDVIPKSTAGKILRRQLKDM
ncbi:4-coumarate--CoA ligase 2-like isoform X1 [Neodiprion fabricii]|uniref:4-coumarate--CoA ligase 2-like isoform X1 n=2 Tax=Neodiprion fabricii TaxID=2872261 RepID=UPI001ED97F5B|nr:4-coumarate--CoA ligase 2-like isoform X1 [Neodiprion fabricii]